MPEATCKVQVSNGHRSASFHTCGRPLSGSEDYPELCKQHAAGKRRSETHNQARKAEDEKARGQMQAAEQIAVTVTAQLGVQVQAETRFDNTIRRWPTGFGLVKLDELQQLATRVAQLETTIEDLKMEAGFREGDR